jgi:hypothetical protein
MDLADKQACAELIQRWGFCRDQGRWPELLDTFAPDGEISVSWFSGTSREFVEHCRRSFDAGQRSKHLLFPALVDGNGDRAMAETSVVIVMRHVIRGVLTDLTSYARFLDRLARRDGRWMILERTTIYERDRIDPVEPSKAFEQLFDAGDLSIYPEAYRYMAACLAAAGGALAPVVYRDGSPHTAQLYTRFAGWLAER